MVRTSWWGTIVVASLLLTGCAAGAAEPVDSPAPEASHTMPDGSEMSGAEHEAHGAEHGGQGTEHEGHEAEASAAAEASDAARMVCDGQVVTAVASVLRLDEEVAPTSSWAAPMYSCTYDIDGAPLVLTVHDAADVATGEQHFARLQASLDGAEEIEGLLGLGMPSFTTGEGIVGFLRDGKTLVVDATALPSELADGTRTQDSAAYAIASAVLVCWVQHD